MLKGSLLALAAALSLTVAAHPTAAVEVKLVGGTLTGISPGDIVEIENTWRVEPSELVNVWAWSIACDGCTILEYNVNNAFGLAPAPPSSPGNLLDWQGDFSVITGDLPGYINFGDFAGPIGSTTAGAPFAGSGLDVLVGRALIQVDEPSGSVVPFFQAIDGIFNQTGEVPTTFIGVDWSDDSCTDTDGDGVCDDEDVCPGGDDNADADGDGVCDSEDICPAGDDNVDADGDGVPDACDPCPVDAGEDTDGDGVCDSEDICPSGDDTLDADGDGVPDACDACPLDSENDADGDGFCESDDNCPDEANPDQANLDGDDEGDICDADVDGDDVLNGDDNCEFDPNPDQDDFDGDGAGDACDADVDNDGVVDAEDACVPTAPGENVDADGCSVAQLCPCENDWKNHGAYVSCVSHTAKDFVDVGLLGKNEKGDVVSAAAQSDCGHKK